MNLITRPSAFDDAMVAALDAARKLTAERLGIVGYGVAHLLDGDGHTKQLVPFKNKITTAGDEYYARMGMALVGTPNAAQPTKVNGMKLGNDSATAASKSGAGATGLVTYITGSNNLFDTTHPQVSAVGGDTGWQITYKNTWAAGDVTNSDIEEVAIVKDAASDADSALADTISRAIITTVNKTSSDSLAITWNHVFLGA